VTEADAAGVSASFTITLSPASGRSVSVAYATANGTATQPADYASTVGTLTFAAGETTKTISVPIAGDLLDEASETFLVNLTSPTSATLVDGQGQGTIDDNDPIPGLSIGDGMAVEASSGTANAFLTLTLAPVSGRPVVVAYATADGTATAPADYVATSGTLTFAAGETAKQIGVPIVGDLVDEPPPYETLFVNLSGPVNAAITDAQGQLTVADDERARMLAPTPGTTLLDPTTFVWSPASQGLGYWLWVGTAPGGRDVYDADQGTGTTAVVANLPTAATTFHVRLWTRLPVSGWVFIDYVYAAKIARKAELLSPAPGSTLPGTSATFTWSAGTSAREYWLELGTTAGGAKLYSASQGLGLSTTVSGLPATGATIYARLWTRFVDVGWVYNDYQFTAASPVAAAITTPVPGTTLSGPVVTFVWTAGVGALEYWLDVGTSTGGTQVYSAAQGTAQAVTVSGLPTGGGPVWVRLWTRLSKAGWTFQDYSYTAAP
jgi:hypothetical protein